MRGLTQRYREYLKIPLSHDKTYFSFLFLSHTHVLPGSPHQLHRCRERLAVVFCVCWKRATSKDRLSVEQRWQTGDEFCCRWSNSCNVYYSAFTTATSASNSSPLPGVQRLKYGKEASRYMNAFMQAYVYTLLSHTCSGRSSLGE